MPKHETKNAEQIQEDRWENEYLFEEMISDIATRFASIPSSTLSKDEIKKHRADFTEHMRAIDVLIAKT